MSFKSAIQPLCRYCGKAIRKQTEDHLVGRDIGGRQDTGIYSKADCQKRTNHQVVSISYSRAYRDGEPTGEKWVRQFTTWDGESWADGYFCSGDHARLFGYACARNGSLVMPAYTRAVEGAAAARSIS